MMLDMTLDRAAEICGATLCGCGDGTMRLNEMVIDSRKVGPGDLFAAFKGEHTDGHDYIDAAFRRGAACCLAERIPEGEMRPILLVENVQKAMGKIAAAHRQALQIPVIGITGSVGKTSAKEMIAAVLERRYPILKTEGNLNNQLGVPMTVSRISPEHRAAVVEMGISGFGEMTELAQIVRPTIGVFTMIGQAHLEFLHDRAGVFRAKTEMLREMTEDGVVIVNGDDDMLSGLECRQRKICFGVGQNCDVRAEELQVDDKGRYSCRIVWGSRQIPVQIPAIGKHMIYAALEGAAVGIVLGLSDEEIRDGIASYRPVGSRSALTQTAYLTLIDDCYNANPDSVKSGIESLKELPGRHVCVLGDMLELGEQKHEMHRQIGAYAVEQGIDLLLCTGALGADIAEGAGKIGRWFPDKENLVAALPGLIREGDCVLVKASRGMHFESIAQALKEL